MFAEDGKHMLPEDQNWVRCKKMYDLLQGTTPFTRCGLQVIGTARLFYNSRNEKGEIRWQSDFDKKNHLNKKTMKNCEWERRHCCRRDVIFCSGNWFWRPIHCHWLAATRSSRPGVHDHASEDCEACWRRWTSTQICQRNWTMQSLYCIFEKRATRLFQSRFWQCIGDRNQCTIMPIVKKY